MITIKQRVWSTFGAAISVPACHFLLGLKPALVGGIVSLIFMQTIGLWLVSKFAGEKQHVIAKSTTEDLQLEPPARCHECGGSLWITDRDNNGMCDPCWEKAEKVTFEQHQAEAIDRARMREGVPLL